MEANVESSVDEDSVKLVRVTGALRLSTVRAVYQSVDFSHKGHRELRIDLDGVEDADSSAVAMCVEWIAQARKYGIHIVFVNVSDTLKRMIRVNRVEELFETANAEKAI